MDKVTQQIIDLVKAAFDRDYDTVPGFEQVSVAPHDDEAWYAVVTFKEGVMVYRAQVSGEGEEGLMFHLVNPLTDKARITTTSHRYVPIPVEVYQEHGSEFANTQGETQASPAWQLLEVLDSGLADDLIEHSHLSQEIETLQPFDIITMIADYRKVVG